MLKVLRFSIVFCFLSPPLVFAQFDSSKKNKPTPQKKCMEAQEIPSIYNNFSLKEASDLDISFSWKYSRKRPLKFKAQQKQVIRKIGKSTCTIFLPIVPQKAILIKEARSLKLKDISTTSISMECDQAKLTKQVGCGEESSYYHTFQFDAGLHQNKKSNIISMICEFPSAYPEVNVNEAYQNLKRHINLCLPPAESLLE